LDDLGRNTEKGTVRKGRGVVEQKGKHSENVAVGRENYDFSVGKASNLRLMIDVIRLVRITYIDRTERGQEKLAKVCPAP